MIDISISDGHVLCLGESSTPVIRKASGLSSLIQSIRLDSVFFSNKFSIVFVFVQVFPVVIQIQMKPKSIQRPTNHLRLLAKNISIRNIAITHLRHHHRHQTHRKNVHIKRKNTMIEDENVDILFSVFLFALSLYNLTQQKQKKPLVLNNFSFH